MATGNQKNHRIVTEIPKLELESYLQNYEGRTRIHRLILIGQTSTVLGVEALKIAVAEAQKGRDVKQYLEAQSLLEAVGPNEPEAVRDLEWMNTWSKKNSAESQRLEEELKGYKNNLIKESIRMGNEELGRHYQKIGEPAKAFEAFSRMRQDAVAAQHIVDCSKHVISVAIEQENWPAVSSNVQKIQGVQQPPDEEKAIQPYLKTALGLAHLDNKDYDVACRAFLNTDAGMGSSCNTFISPNDVATYGGICALASMDRNELQMDVLENSNFRTYLELEPHIRRAISFFVNSRYSACLEILESYRPDYLLDIYLQKHVEDLYQMIRTKSIVQYFIPFSCVTLDSLNEAFAPPGTTIDKELSKMIENGELKGRMDTQNKLLTSAPVASRSTLHRNALNTAKVYEREAQRRIQHMNIVGADLEIKGKGRGGGGHFDDIDSFSGSFSGTGRSLRSGGY